MAWGRFVLDGSRSVTTLDRDAAWRVFVPPWLLDVQPSVAASRQMCRWSSGRFGGD
jgi:hypothetical protein